VGEKNSPSKFPKKNKVLKKVLSFVCGYLLEEYFFIPNAISVIEDPKKMLSTEINKLLLKSRPPLCQTESY
jgi:hypothetical protein